jgi:hypothetical protein
LCPANSHGSDLGPRSLALTIGELEKRKLE